MTNETTPDALEAALCKMYRIIVCDYGALSDMTVTATLALEGFLAERRRHAEEVAALRDQLREVTAERDREREHATKMEAELADRRAHDEDVRTCLEYCDEDDPTPGGIGGLARELLAAKFLREGGEDG